MNILIPLMSFVSVFLLLAGLYWLYGEKFRIVEHRIKIYTGRMHSPWGLKQGEGLPPWQRWLRWAGKKMASQKVTDKIEEDLAKAGLPIRAEEFIAIQLGISLGLPFLMFSLTKNAGGAVVVGLTAYAGCKFFVNKGKAKRARLFNDQLIDCLSVMSNSLRAGFSFPQSMDLISREMPAPISEEFARTLREMNLGKSTEESLEKMARRIDSPDLDLVITTVLIQRQVGGNLSEILDIISETIRERIRIKGEIRTLTAQGRMSGTVIALLPVAISGLLIVVSPEYMMPLFKEDIGLIMVGAAVGSIGLGWLTIKKITNIEV